MERGGSSNIEYKYTTRACTSGIVIREGEGARAAAAPAAAAPAAAAPANIPAGEVNQEQQAAAFRREADQYMPIANITRIMRRVLPAHAKIADDAKEAIQECVSEFIGFITAEANGRCHRDYRKIVTPDDVLAAMASLGLDDYLEPLSVFLNKYRAQDPDRGVSSSQLSPQVVRRGGGGFVHQPQQVAQMVRPPPPPPPPAVMPSVGYYTPLPPSPAVEVDDEDEFGTGYTQAINEYICNHGGGEGSSGGREFDLFLRTFK